MIFFLPMMVIKEGLAMLSEFTEGIDMEKWLWRMPYFLIGILSFIVVVLWLEGYR
jgi:hypothetical protein